MAIDIPRPNLPKNLYIPQMYLKQPTAFILPHLGSATKKTRMAMANLAIDNIDEFFSTGKCLNIIN